MFINQHQLPKSIYLAVIYKRPLKRAILVLIGIALTLLIFLSGSVAGYFLPKLEWPSMQFILKEQKKDIYLQLLLEIYDKIKLNYWEDISDDQLAILFELAAEKVHNTNYDLSLKDKQGLKIMLSHILKNIDDKKKKDFVVNIAGAIVANLKPSGRSSFYTQKSQQDLKNLVQNINPDKNLYKDMGVEKGASVEEVERSFKSQTEQLERQKTQAKEPQEKKEIEKKIETINYAHQVLSAQEKRERYDTYGIEPTVFTRLIGNSVLHLHIRKMSPTTFDEFKKAIQSYDNEQGPKYLIFDLKGNIGGALDIVPLLTGAFLGHNQYSFDLFHKGKYEVVRTNTDKLTGIERFKQKVVLTDNETQSSAEITAATLKKYNLGIVVGSKTKGWGTIEKIYPLDNQIDSTERYSLLLANNITLRDDGQPIEGRGVEPDINIQDLDWDSQLFAYTHDDVLVSAVKEVVK